MQIAKFENQATMSSREIADLVESRHDKVKQSIDRLAARGVIQLPPMGVVLNNQGQTISEFLVCKRDSYIIVAQLSPEFTARLVDRWQELESKQFKIPTTLSGALRLAAEQAETIEAQTLQLEAQQPAVEFVERFVEAKSSKGIREVAKILGIPERTFIKLLDDDGIIFKLAGNWVPMSNYQKRGWFEVKAGESNGHTFKQMRFTPDGLVWAAKRYAMACT